MLKALIILLRDLAWRVTGIWKVLLMVSLRSNRMTPLSRVNPAVKSWAMDLKRLTAYATKLSGISIADMLHLGCVATFCTGGPGVPVVGLLQATTHWMALWMLAMVRLMNSLSLG